MHFGNNLKNNPMVPIENAVNLIAYTAIQKFGVECPETMYQSVLKLKSHIVQIMNSDKSITKKYYAEIRFPKGDTSIEEVDYSYIERNGGNSEFSVVNIVELLESCNETFKINGRLPIIIPGLNGSNVDLDNNNAGIKPNVLIDLASSIIDVAKNIIDREGRVTVETFDTIFHETMQNIMEPTIIDALSDIKKILREELKSKVTKGRPAEITVKKVLAGISLADNFPGKLPFDEKPLYKAISGIKLLSKDRAEVVKIFKDLRKK